MQSPFIRTIHEWIRENHWIEDRGKVAVAFSGGPDSVCLLAVLKELGYQVGAVHVNHHLRPNADRDASFAASVTQSLGVPFVSEDVFVLPYAESTGKTIEEAARDLRYEALLRGASRLFSEDVMIATGHHSDDQAETVLFHLIRGTGVRGAGGIPKKTGRIIRPLLPVSREAVLQYLNEKGLPYVVDETNETDDATRNQIRHHVMPALKDVRPDAAEKISEAAFRFQEAEDYLETQAGKALSSVQIGETPEEIRIRPADFLRLDPIIRRYVVRRAMEMLGIPLKDKASTHFQAVAGLAEKPVGKEITLPGGGYAVRTYEALSIRKSKPALRESGPKLKMIVRPSEFPLKNAENPYTKRFDCDKINESGLVLRTREPYDRIAIGPGAHKTLKRFMIDEKIPKELRDRVPVVACGHEVLWIVGYRVSSAFLVKPSTEKVLEITIIEE